MYDTSFQPAMAAWFVAMMAIGSMVGLVLYAATAMPATPQSEPRRRRPRAVDDLTVAVDDFIAENT